MRIFGRETGARTRERTSFGPRHNPSRDAGGRRTAAGSVLIALFLSILSAAGAAAGQLDEGYAMQPRLDLPRPSQPTWMQMNQAADEMERAMEEKAPAAARAPGHRPAWRDDFDATAPIIMLVLMLALGIGMFLGLRSAQSPAKPRTRGDLEKDWSPLSARERLDLEPQMDLAWVPGPETIVFTLHDVERVDNEFSARLAGEHEGRAFGFRLRWTMCYGPVALLDWFRTGPESDALIDILADKAGIPRGESSFEPHVRSSAIILDAWPANTPFERLDKINAKAFFELAKGNPELLLEFDFAAGTGLIDEKWPGFRTDLVHAFHAPEKAARKDADEEPADEEEPEDDRSYLPDDDEQRALAWEHDHPWVPVAFRLDDLERTAASFAFRARGEHNGHAFGFRLRVTRTDGRFAICEWWRTGHESEALIDIVAEHTQRLREHCRFDAHVTAKALIVCGQPSHAAFDRLESIELNVIFDRAMLRPELALRISFATSTGEILEIDESHRWALMSAFQDGRPR